MNAVELVRSYLNVALPGPNLDPDRIRPLLADDFVVDDPLMGAAGPDDFVARIRQAAAAGSGGETSIEAIVGDDTVVAALTRFRMGETSVAFSQWFWARNARIQKCRVIYDPSPFLTRRP